MAPFVSGDQWLAWKDFLALPQVEDDSDFHCVTSWSRMGNQWCGVRFPTLVEQTGVKPDTPHVNINAYDGYSTKLPLAESWFNDLYS
jgi:DMSO/TMAO reductase YedYZ molybdopterin-dependent catalytic subunit